MASYNPLKKNTAQRIVFPILDADGDPVGGASALDSEYSIDGGVFTDCTNEATNITSGGSNTGAYYLDLVAAETNGDVICIQVKSTEGKTTILVFYTTTGTIDSIQTEVNKIGTIVNTGGTATIGGVLGDFANSALVNRVGAGAAQSATALSTATWTAARAGYLDNINNANLATVPAISAARIGYLDNINQAGLLQITAARAGYLDNINQAGLLQLTAARVGYLDNINNASLASIALTGALVNCQVKGQDNIDFGALQKASLNAATPSVTVSDKTGFSLSVAGIDSVWDEVIDANAPANANSARETLNVVAAAVAGKNSGNELGTPTFRDLGDTKNRITSTVDANNNRTAVTQDGT
jgi:hypothetical protein